MKNASARSMQTQGTFLAPKSDGVSWIRKTVNFSHYRKAPGVVTALSIRHSQRRGGRSLPGYATSILSGVSLLPVITLFTRGRS
jgi:hypothetical protein